MNELRMGIEKLTKTLHSKLCTLNSKGFTLVELLVVVAIISGLAGFFVPKFINYSEFRELQNAASDLQSAVRLAQNNAQTGVVCLGGISAKNWYLYFSGADTYRLETVCIGPTPEAGTPTPTPPVSTLYKFPAGVSIDIIELNSCAGIDLKDPGLKVIFSNISGVLSFEVEGTNAGCGSSSFAKTLTVRLKSLSDPDNPLSVIIEKGGSVYVKAD